ncbi:MAG: hypothetical protein V3575_06405 [Candidatus Absconditabacteria bacterium]
MLQAHEPGGSSVNNKNIPALTSDMETRKFIDFLVFSTDTNHSEYSKLQSADLPMLSQILEKLLLSFEDPNKDNKAYLLKKITLLISLIFEKNEPGQWQHYKYYLIDTLHKNVQKSTNVPFRIKCELYKNLLSSMYLVGDFQRFIENEKEFEEFFKELLGVIEKEPNTILNEYKLTPTALFSYISSITTNFSYFASVLGDSNFISNYQLKVYNLLNKKCPNTLVANKVLISTIGFLEKEIDLKKDTKTTINSKEADTISKLKKTLLQGINIISNDPELLSTAKVLSLFLRFLNNNIVDLATLKYYVQEITSQHSQGNVSDELLIQFNLKVYDYLNKNKDKITVSQDFLESHLSTALKIAEKQTNMLLLMPIYIRYIENPGNSFLRREQFFRTWKLGIDTLGSRFYLSYYGKYLLKAVRLHMSLSDIAQETSQVVGDSDLSSLSDSVLSCILDKSTESHYQKIQIKELNKSISKELRPTSNDFVETDVTFHGNTHLKVETKAKLIYIISLIMSRCKSIRFMVHTEAKPPIFFTLGFSSSHKKILVRKYLGKLSEDANHIDISVGDFMAGLESMTMHGFTYNLDGKDYNVFFDKGKNDTKAFLPEVVEEIKELIEKCIDVYYQDLPKDGSE